MKRARSSTGSSTASSSNSARKKPRGVGEDEDLDSSMEVAASLSVVPSQLELQDEQTAVVKSEKVLVSLW